jgi:hypothetical protein
MLMALTIALRTGPGRLSNSNEAAVKKHPPGEHLIFNVTKPLLTQSQQTGHSFRRRQSRQDYLVLEYVTCHFDRSELQVLLGTKMRK